jgi:recombination protein RecT
MTTTAPSTEVATTTDGPPTTVYGFIDRLKPQIAQALPAHMDSDRIARLALTVVRQSDVEAHKQRKPENSLANCTPESFAGALLTAAALGLEPGVLQEAYLVPYKGECTLIVGYQGFAKLFWQHPLAKHLDAHAVHENDSFDYAYGLAQFLRHKPVRGERGKITHYYAVAELSTGASAFVVLTVDEVKALRGGKVGPSGKIPDPMHWMERKTCIRQLVKLLPKTPNLAAALAVDEQPGTRLVEQGVATAIASGESFAALPPSLADENEERAAEDQAQRVTAADVTKPEPAATEVPTPTDQPSATSDAGDATPAEEPAAVESPTDDVEDACPACGAIPSHAPSDCPMGDM